MSAGLRHSTIETFRKRNHANCVLRLYKLSNDGQTLTKSAELSKGFFLNVAPDSGEGKTAHQLVIDKIFTDSLTVAILLGFVSVDLVNTVTGEARRYTVDSDTRPIVNDWRYVYGIWAAYNDTRAVSV